MKEFTSCDYDIMNISEKGFDDDFFKFRNKIKELERRLASVITQAFDDADTLVDRFNLLDSFEDLLKRPVIQDELEKKHIVLIEDYKKDLKTVQKIFSDYRDHVEKCDEHAPLYANMPPISGALLWIKSLKDRISGPKDKLATISPDIVNREEYSDVVKTYNAIKESLEQYEEKKKHKWQTEILESKKKLEEPLLSKVDKEKTLKVNFDSELVKLLREVKYFYQMELEVPPEAAEIYKKAETYRHQINDLDSIVQKYNAIVTQLHPVEKPLVEARIEKMDEVLKEGIEVLRWEKDKDIKAFISKSEKIVSDTYRVVEKMQSSLQSIHEILAKINKPMIERKTNKVRVPEEFHSDQNAVMAQYHGEIKADSTNISNFIREINEAVNHRKSEPIWRNYLDYVNGIVIEGISNAICTSLNKLNELISVRQNREKDYVPLFDVKIELSNKEIRFEPNVMFIPDPEAKTVRNIINMIADEFIHLNYLISRLDTEKVGDYLVEMKDNFEIRDSLAMINNNLDALEDECTIYKNEFSEHSHLWTKDPEETFKELLASEALVVAEPKYDEDGNVIEEQESTQDDPLVQGVVTKLPKFEVFDKKINELKQIEKKIKSYKEKRDIGWLRVDAKPLLNSLEQKVEKWINTYTDFFLEQIRTIFVNCNNFMKYLEDGIAENPSKKPEDKKLLMNTMEVLSKHRLVAKNIEKNMEFQKQMIDLLRRHDAAPENEDFYTKKDEVIVHFKDISDQKVVHIKSEILPLQQIETNALKIRITEFEQEVKDFKKKFDKEAPKNYSHDMSTEDVEKQYKVIDDFYYQLIELNKKTAMFNDLEILFDLEPTKYKALRDTMQEINDLKQLWDLIAMVSYSYDRMRTVLWNEIDINEFTTDNEQFAGVVKSNAKKLKYFPGFKKLDNKVENMTTILTCVASLKDVKLEDRHWDGLSDIVQKPIDHKETATFTFGSIVELDVHKNSEKVNELAETAKKEEKYEKQLMDIRKEWDDKAFEFESFH